MISHMRFDQWHAVVPEPRWEETRQALEAGNQLRFRFGLMVWRLCPVYNRDDRADSDERWPCLWPIRT